MESLILEYAELKGLTLDEVADSLDDLRLDGNPLKCDCTSRWLWNKTIEKNGGHADEVQKRWILPPCATPFNLRGKRLENMEGICKPFIKKEYMYFCTVYILQGQHCLQAQLG